MERRSIRLFLRMITDVMADRLNEATYLAPHCLRAGRCGAIGCLLLLFVLGTDALRGQQIESRSYIVRIAPGVEVKGMIERIASVAPALDVPLMVRPVIASGHGNRTLLSEHRLDRYLVVDRTDAGEEGESGMRSLLETLDGVETVFPNHVYRVHASPPDDELFGEQWALDKIDALRAWEVTLGNPDVLIGVLDTGIEWDHPDLADAFRINGPEDLNGNNRFDPWPSDEVRDGVAGDLDGIDQDGNGYPDDVIGYDFVDQDVPNVGDWNGRDALPEDDQGHGTNVAGVIAAARDNVIGIAGIAPGCRLVALRAFDGTGNGQDDDVAAAIVYAADRGVDVLNMSFGDFYRSPLMYDAVRYAYDRGVLLIASSGNDGVSDPHYPSGFAEVVAVGATDTADRLSPFSTFGSQLSLTAPGVDITTTNLDGGYRSVSGTSFAAPYVAGVAALLRGLHPDWTHDEIAASIEIATNDLGGSGWDENFGAGRLNAGNAVHSPGPALVAINVPLMDEGADVDSVVSIRGSAIAPLLQSWSLEVGEGSLPEEWMPLAESEEGIHGGVLGALNTADYADTLLTLRLTLRLTNGRTVERRTRFFLDRTPPVADDFNLRNVWRFDRRSLALTFRTDDPTRGTVWVRPADGTGKPYLPIELEPERSGLTRIHYHFLTSLELSPGTPYDLYVELTNPAGGTTRIGTPDDPLNAMIEQDAFPVGTMSRREWSLPYSFVLNEKLTLTDDGRPEILLNRLDAFAFEKLLLYRFEEDRFVPVDSAGNWIPRAVGDSDGDGLLEVLGQSSRTGIVYEQTAPGGSPFASVLYADSTSGRFYPSTFFDFDGDGRDELIGYTSEQESTEQYYFIASWNGSAYVERLRMPNATLPERGFSRNFMGASDVVLADFNGNGVIDILFGDDDGDFMIYECDYPNACTLLWADENEGEESDRMIAAGDLDRDGIDEAVVAWRSPGTKNEDREFDPPLWTLKAISLKDAGAVEIAVEEFAYVRPSNPFRSGIELGDLDGSPGAEIALSVFPNMYVLRWDEELRRLRPFWWRENSIINRPVVQDFNGDGTNELGFGDGQTVLFYQIDPDTQAPASPAGAQGWALDDSTAYIEWEPVAGIGTYRVYRAALDDSGPISYVHVATVDSISVIDTGFGTPNGRLDPNRLYGYIVTALDDSGGDPESRGSREVMVFTHVPIRVVNAQVANAREIRVEMSGRVSEKLYRSGALDVRRDGTPVPVSSVFTTGERTVLLSLREEVYDATLTIRPTGLFRDYYESPADTSVAIAVAMPPRHDSAVFIATRAAPLEGRTIAVEFSAPVDPASATDPANYMLDPDGEIVSLAIDPEDPRSVLMVVEDSYPLGPYGYEYLITIRNVGSTDGRAITTGAGSVVGFTISADDLEGVFVYPHPFSLSMDREVTFAGLTPLATIRVYTQAGALLREIGATSGDGGMAWDGTDARGRIVPTGIYLYSVVARSPDGAERESRLRKIAVVP